MSTQLSVGIGFYLRCSLLRLRVFSILSGNVISVEVRQIYTATCHLVYASILVQPEFINAVSLFELLEISVRNSLFPIFIRQFSDLVFHFGKVQTYIPFPFPVADDIPVGREFPSLLETSPMFRQTVERPVDKSVAPADSGWINLNSKSSECLL